jgi:hypothetical protein
MKGNIYIEDKRKFTIAKLYFGRVWIKLINEEGLLSWSFFNKSIFVPAIIKLEINTHIFDNLMNKEEVFVLSSEKPYKGETLFLIASINVINDIIINIAEERFIVCLSLGFFFEPRFEIDEEED